jgi:hypothetical protein
MRTLRKIIAGQVVMQEFGCYDDVGGKTIHSIQHPSWISSSQQSADHLIIKTNDEL